MDNVTELLPLDTTVRRGATLKRLFVVAYVTAATVAMFGWISAFGWLTVRIGHWLLA